MARMSKMTALVAFALVALTCFVTVPLSAQDKSPLAKYWKESGKSFPAGKNFVKPEKWAAGQYFLMGTKTKGKYESVSRTLVVGKEAGGWIIEVNNIDKKGKETASQMLLKGYEEAVDANDYKKVGIGWMKMKDEKGVVQEIGEDQMALFNMFAKASYENLVVNISKFTDGGAVSVPGGSFAGTNMYTTSTKIMGMTIETDGWFNSAVPVNGMVKSQSKDGKTVTELLDFGFDGKSQF